MSSIVSAGQQPCGLYHFLFELPEITILANPPPCTPPPNPQSKFMIQSIYASNVLLYSMITRLYSMITRLCSKMYAFKITLEDMLSCSSTHRPYMQRMSQPLSCTVQYILVDSLKRQNKNNLNTLIKSGLSPDLVESQVKLLIAKRSARASWPGVPQC